MPIGRLIRVVPHRGVHEPALVDQRLRRGGPRARAAAAGFATCHLVTKLAQVCNQHRFCHPFVDGPASEAAGVIVGKRVCQQRWRQATRHGWLHELGEGSMLSAHGRDRSGSQAPTQLQSQFETEEVSASTQLGIGLFARTSYTAGSPQLGRQIHRSHFEQQ